MKLIFMSLDSQFIHSNLALLSLAEIAKEEGFSPVVIEANINEHLRDILRKLPLGDVYFFSSYIWNDELLRKLISDVRKQTQATIVVGGPQASTAPESYFEVGATFVCVGEGESALKSLLRGESHEALIKKGERANWFREKELHFPYPFSFFDARKISYYETQRGCPYACSYCLSSIQRELVFKELSLVEKDLKELIRRGATLIKFVDRTFNVDSKRTLELLSLFKRLDNGNITFHLEISPHALNEEQVSMMNALRPGLIQVEIGIQAIQSHVLEAIHRKPYREENYDLIRKLRVHKHLDIIAGLPFMTYEDVKETFNALVELGSDEIQLGFLKVLPKTPITSEKGIVHSDYAPFEVLKTDWISVEELNRLRAMEKIMSWFHKESFPNFFMAYKSDLFSLYEALSEIDFDGSFESRIEKISAYLNDSNLDECLELDYRVKQRRNRPVLLPEIEVKDSRLEVLSKKHYDRKNNALFLVHMNEQRLFDGKLHYVLLDREKRTLEWMNDASDGISQ
ncbi:B12-binding domain-containing radical SAM protein [Guggenheimella bovis]